MIYIYMYVCIYIYIRASEYVHIHIHRHREEYQGILILGYVEFRPSEKIRGSFLEVADPYCALSPKP